MNNIPQKKNIAAMVPTIRAAQNRARTDAEYCANSTGASVHGQM